MLQLGEGQAGPEKGSRGHLKTNMSESGTRKFSLLPEFTLNMFKQHMTISWYKSITGNWVEDKNKWADSGVELLLVWEAWSFPGEISYFQAVLPWWRRDLVSEYSGLLHPHWVNLSLDQKWWEAHAMGFEHVLNWFSWVNFLHSEQISQGLSASID